MRTLLTIAILSLMAMGCQKSVTAPTYNVTCTIYSISTTTGDTSVHYSLAFPNSYLTAQQLEDSINLSVNGGNHPFSFTDCN